MGWKLAFAAVAAAGITVGGAQGQPAPKPWAGPQPYLTGAAVPDTIKILPPSPRKGDAARYEADRKEFLGTRKLQGTPRWAMATFDDAAPPAKVFACSLGVELTAQNAPKFSAMIGRIGRESGRAMNGPKDFYKRQRPFQIDKGPTCIDQTGPIKDSFDYPSGHTTFGWALGLILAELAPDRANEILSRARAFGESRMVCGVHNMSAVESGRTNGSIVVAALHGSAEFRADMDAARAEIAAARKAGPAPDPAACAKEAETETSPY